jgi:serine protease
VAGTIGGSTYGVAKEVNLHPVRVLGCDGKGSVIGVIAGLNWIIENGQTPGVVNMSLGGPTSDSLDIAVNNVIDAGFSVVVAAGNENSDACQVSPARAADAITVGATNSSDTRAWFSNYGTCLDLFAPGVSIKSAYNSSGTATAYLSGTSMAAPHVAGAAALYLQKDSSATPQNVTQFITNSATNGVINNAETGSPNQLLFLSSGPIPLQPTGTVLGGSPVFEWIKIENVSQYQLELYERATDVLVDSRVISSDVCVQTKCSVDPGFSLDTEVGQYGWRTRVYDEEPFGEWTDMLFFNYAEPQHFYLPLIIRD